MPATSVMTRSITAQLRVAAAAAASSQRTGVQERKELYREDESEGSDPSSQPPPPPATPPSSRIPLGSCNGVSSNHHQQQNGAHKRHQSLSPVPSGHENGSRAVTPPHTPPKLTHHSPAKNGHASPSRGGDASSREDSPSARCTAPKSPPTPHKIKLLEEKENEKKPKKNLNKNGSFQLIPVAQQNGHKPEPVKPVPRKPEATVVQQHQSKLTNFFPIRRSERRPKTEVEAKQQKTIEERLISNSDTDLGLKVQHFPEKGRGVSATRNFSKGEFVVEYSGDLIDVKIAKERENKYAMDLSKGCYMYYFRANNRQYCIDATSETGRLGRLVNHSRVTPNLQTKVVVFRDKPRLILVAKRDIEAGEELLYDYGDRSRESMEAHPWLAL